MTIQCFCTHADKETQGILWSSDKLLSAVRQCFLGTSGSIAANPVTEIGTQAAGGVLSHSDLGTLTNAFSPESAYPASQLSSTTSEA